VRKLIVFAVALVAALALTVPGALGGAEQAGINARSITIGGTFPLTGPAAAYAPIPIGMRAYFSYINARRGPDGKRGIRGRQIVWKYYDDGYNPANTIQLTRRLVEQDRVFATVGQLGTEHNIAVRPYMNQRRVPQSLVSTGASTGSTSGRTTPARESRSSTRTTSTGRTTCTASARRSAVCTHRPTSWPRRPSR
jgi:ABC-type branched-subunit amino acid transport system substrate-binding protein